MKILLICPSNILLMPYVRKYIKIIEPLDLEFKVITWDRLNINDGDTNYTFKDSKTGPRRSFSDYMDFANFIGTILKNEKFDRVIVFSIQLAFFIKKLLLPRFENRFIFDIRDRHPLVFLFWIRKFIEGSYLTSISSPGFLDWLPNCSNYIISHNTTIDSVPQLSCESSKFSSLPIRICCIGAIREFAENSRLLVQTSKADNNYVHFFHGEGPASLKLQNFAKQNKITNASFTGMYSPEEECHLYSDSDLINILFYGNTENKKTLLPNRLYNAVIYGKPVICYPGTYTSKIVSENNLGLVVKNQKTILKDLEDYIKNFNQEKYTSGRLSFIKSVTHENIIFKNRIVEFLNNH